MSRRLALLVVGAILATASACGGGTGPGAMPAVAFSRSTEEYLPGVDADVYVPTVPGPAPIVVLVPGGAWRTADRSGLTPLAERLAAAGMVVVNATYRAADAGARFPSEVRDVICSVDFAATRAAAGARRPGPVVVVGHSSGGHLAALAALATDHFRGGCPYRPAAVDGFIGLAGLYDVAAVADVAEPLFGVPLEQDPDRWRDGNAVTWASAVPSLPVFLAHGDRDDLVPVAFTTSFAAALEAGGHQVRVEIVPDAGHHDMYAPDVIGTQMIAWIQGLTRPPTGAGATTRSFSGTSYAGSGERRHSRRASSPITIATAMNPRLMSHSNSPLPLSGDDSKRRSNHSGTTCVTMARTTPITAQTDSVQKRRRNVRFNTRFLSHCGAAGR